MSCHNLNLRRLIARTVVCGGTESDVAVKRCIRAACVAMVDGRAWNATDAEGRGRRSAISWRRGERPAAADWAPADRVRRGSRPTFTADTRIRAAVNSGPTGTVDQRQTGTVSDRKLIDRQHSHAVLSCQNRTISLWTQQAITRARTDYFSNIFTSRKFSAACYLIILAIYPHMSIGKVWIYRLLFVCLFVCTVTDFSSEDRASGVKFCTMVDRCPGQGISHFGELCSPKAQNRTNWPPTRK